MLTMVIAKPIQITMVRAEPLIPAAAVEATRAENCGESAATVMPQIIKKAMKEKLLASIIQAEIKQQRHEIASE